MIIPRRWHWAIHLVLILGVITTLVPFLFTMINSIKFFKDIAAGSLIFEPTLVNYERLFFSKQASFHKNVTNSLLIAFFTTISVLVIATLAAYSLERFKWSRWLTGILGSWILLLHIIPGVTLVGPIYLMFRSLGLYNNLLGVTLVHTLINLPMSIWVIQSFIQELPCELEESALIDGCGYLGSFIRIVVPLIAPGLAAVAVLTFVFSWNEFLYALNLTSMNTATIPVAIAKFAQQYEIRYGEMSAAAFVATIPALVFLFVAQRQIVKGLTLGALK